MSKARSFVEYALQGFYAQARRADPKPKKFFTISKAGMAQVFGASRIGYAQREEMQATCQRLGIAMAELSDKIIFFDPAQIAGEDYDMTAKAAQLRKLTEEFDRLKRTAADEEWARRFEGDKG